MIFMIKDIQAVIFDLDGSLVDSMWIWRQIDIEYLARYGLELPEDLQSCIEGMSFRETAEYFKKRFAIPETILQMQNTWNQMAWDKYANEIFLKAGAHEFLNGCRAQGIKLGIASSNSRELINVCLKRNQVEDYFECIMCGTDGLPGKPAPDIYLAAAKKLDVSPAHCLVFEDIVPGILAGKSAGMRVCAVEDMYSIHQKAEKEALADYYIKDFFNIL